MNLTAQEKAFFADFALLLQKHEEMDGQFSLWRIHQHHNLEADEVLHETSDIQKRVSITSVIKKENLPQSAFPSQWVVRANGDISVNFWCCD